MTRRYGWRRRDAAHAGRLGVERCEPRLPLAGDSGDAGGMIAIEPDVRAASIAPLTSMGSWSSMLDGQLASFAIVVTASRPDFSAALSALQFQTREPALSPQQADMAMIGDVSTNDRRGERTQGFDSIAGDDSAGVTDGPSAAVAERVVITTVASGEPTRAGFDPLLFQAASLTSQPMAAAFRTVTLSRQSGRWWNEKPGRIEPLVIVDPGAATGSAGPGTGITAAMPGGLIDVQAAMVQAGSPSPKTTPATVASVVLRPSAGRGREVNVTMADTGSLVRAVVSWHPEPGRDGGALDSGHGTVTSSNAADAEMPQGYLAPPPPRIMPADPASREDGESWAAPVSVAAVVFWASHRLQSRLPDPQQPVARGQQLLRSESRGRSGSLPRPA